MMESLPAENQVDPHKSEDCAGTLPELALKGIQLFNQARYFEAHEELELAWRQETGPIRELYRGILQVAVAYLHVRNGNLVGAKKMMLRSKRWLAPFPEICQGVRIGQLRRDAAAVEQLLYSGISKENLRSLVLKPVQMSDRAERTG
ncbi:MAG TPA: DUF309 domain-containing protein [Anaerolineaceae bacterium]|nr:DUF309 domain-containing protein [Anaerolineaceae bacterium]